MSYGVCVSESFHQRRKMLGFFWMVMDLGGGGSFFFCADSLPSFRGPMNAIQI